MNCKAVQGYILTDYIDERLADESKKLVDQHLAYCQTCRNFFMTVKKETVNPFKNVMGIVPDASLWNRIKGAIEEAQPQEKENSLLQGFWERFTAVYIPKPALALAAATMMILMLGITGPIFLERPLTQFNEKDQIQYLSSLIDEPADAGINNSRDAQTPIEKYFL